MFIATSNQIFEIEENKEPTSPILRFEAEGIVRLERGRDHAAIALEDGRIVVLANGHTTELPHGVPEPIEALAVLDEDPLHLLVGTEGPHIYYLDDSAAPQLLDGFESLSCRDQWYTPWGGPAAVRSFARSDDWIYADIHVGSIMRSPDRGTSWEPVTPDLHADVHQVATAPRAPDRLYANTADAVYLSEDRGSSWHHRSSGLPERYGRAIAVHPHDPDCLLATISGGPGSNVEGKLFRSTDAGCSWTHATSGFPPTTRNNIDTFHLTFSPSGTAWTAVEETLYTSTDKGETWTTPWQAPSPIIALATEN